jgi:phage tail-like protein
VHHLSLPSYALEGEATSKFPLDSGSTQTVWHRLYLEANIPANCGIKIFLAATDTRENTIPDNDWHEHQFGKGFADRGAPGIPVGAWVPSPSEIPLHPGLGLCPMEKDHSGLFTVLAQRSHRPVRTLRGRYLHVWVQHYGDKLSSPEIWALRAYASRFSYLNNYLPELYHETRFGPDADHYQINVQSTPADFLERFLDNFEGLLTPLEDLIRSSYLLTDPRSTREDALEWLASWIGLSFDSAYPVHRRRRLLLEAPKMYKHRGTLYGLERALDVATDDGVRQGRVLVLENFRLRRTFATILGADLADEDDPLLARLAISGNSYVGDTLLLEDEEKKAFLALFNADLPKDLSEQAAIADLYDGLAYRVTVLVHEEVVPEELGQIRRVVDLETPAHVLTRVITASYPLMVGIASLVGIDTYLREGPAPLPVRVEESHIGLRDLIQRPPSLDPRLEGGQEWLSATPRPVADPMADSPVGFGESITLDGSRSGAAEGLSIVEYLWRMLE